MSRRACRVPGPIRTRSTDPSRWQNRRSPQPAKTVGRAGGQAIVQSHRPRACESSHRSSAGGERASRGPDRSPRRPAADPPPGPAAGPRGGRARASLRGRAPGVEEDRPAEAVESRSSVEARSRRVEADPARGRARRRGGSGPSTGRTCAERITSATSRRGGLRPSPGRVGRGRRAGLRRDHLDAGGGSPSDGKRDLARCPVEPAVEQAQRG